MKIHYLGTGAAEGVPAVFCNCENCKIARERGGRNIRTRSQVIIDGTLGIDFPPDAYLHSLNGADLSKLSHLIVTHSHMDHFYAHDFILRGYKYAWDITSPKLCIYGNGEVLKVYEECTKREMKAVVGENISLNYIPLYTPTKVGSYTVTALRAQHSVSETAYVYLIEDEKTAYLHLTDTGMLYGDVYEFLKGYGKRINAVCFDCTFVNFTKGEVGRHMGIEDNMAVKAELEKIGVCDKDTKYFITHFSHNGAPFEDVLSEIEQKYSVTACYDNMLVEI